MKIATIIARTLLGLIFVVFGLNAFFNFIPLPPPKGELAGDFMKALFSQPLSIRREMLRDFRRPDFVEWTFHAARPHAASARSS